MWGLLWGRIDALFDSTHRTHRDGGFVLSCLRWGVMSSVTTPSSFVRDSVGYLILRAPAALQSAVLSESRVRPSKSSVPRKIVTDGTGLVWCFMSHRVPVMVGRSPIV